MAQLGHHIGVTCRFCKVNFKTRNTEQVRMRCCLPCWEFDKPGMESFAKAAEFWGTPEEALRRK